VTEVKLGKDASFYYFPWGTLDRLRLWPPGALLLTSHCRLSGAFGAPNSQFAYQILGEYIHVFGQDISSTHVVAFRDIGQVFATGTQRIAAHCIFPAPQDWADPAEDNAEKLQISCCR